MSKRKQASILTFLSPVRNACSKTSSEEHEDPRVEVSNEGPPRSTITTPDKGNSKPYVENEVKKRMFDQDEVQKCVGIGKRFSVKRLLEESEKDTRDPNESLPLPKIRPSPRGALSKSGSSRFGLLEIVWAKYSLYPPWPAIVCFHEDEYLKGDKIHVQFFDSIKSRAWVRIDNVQKANQDRPLKEESISGNHKWRKELKQAVQQASKAERKDPKGRQALIGVANEETNNNETTSEEEEEEQEEDFKLDDSTEEDDEEYEEKKPKSKKRRRSSGNAKKNPATKKARGRAVSSTKRVKENRPPRLSGQSEENLESQNLDDLSEYELIRQRNIESRRRMFMELNISDSKQRLSDSFYGPQTAGQKHQASRRGLAARKSNGTVSKDVDLPVRKSLRLQNLAADNSVSLPEKEPVFYNVPVTEEHPRLPIKTLELADVVLEADHVDEKASFLTTLGPCLKEKGEETAASFGEDIKSSIKQLAITEAQVAKVVPDRIFSLAVHPTKFKRLVAAGGKWGGIGLWDVDDVDSHSHGVHLFTPHSRPVNCLSFSKYEPNRLISTSYDGTVRYLDLETQKVLLLYGDEVDKTFAAYHHQLNSHVLLLALGSSGQVGLIDNRESNVKFSRRLQLYIPRTAVKTVDAHPINRDIFLCCTSKGSCDSFDLRGKGQNCDNYDLPPLVEYTGHTKALSSAFYSPVTGATINTVCYDNKIRLYDVSASQSGSVSPRRAVHHNNQTGRWLTTFKAEWHPRRDDLFFVGSMEQPRRIDAISSGGDLLCTLRGDSLGSVCSIVKCHPSTDMVVGGNSSGRVHVFV